MWILEGRLILSATDQSDFLACQHLVHLKHASVRGEPIPRSETEMAKLLQQLGQEHERRHLEQLVQPGQTSIEFSEDLARNSTTYGELEAAAAAAREAMRSGIDVIYQPSFLDGDWYGRADFLKRVEPPPGFTYSYEVHDAKLATTAHAEALLQLCEYSRQVALVQGHPPARMHIVLGDSSTVSFAYADFASYHAMVRRRVEEAAFEDLHDVYPRKVRHCSICVFADHCKEQRKRDDHLSLVARIRNDQIRRLEMADVGSLTTLARLPAGTDVPRMLPQTVGTLHEQARLQKEGPLPDGTPRHELLAETAEGFGLCALPVPSGGDVFFDMEGVPFGTQGLEYLFGAVELVDGLPAYHAWWAHDAAQERRAFEDFVDWVMARRRGDPTMHIYHYADYERSALRRLMGRHGTREQEVDELLRGQAFVDLYRVVRQGVRLSTDSYGLKAVERLYAPERTGDVADAGMSMVMYERWRRRESDDTGDASLLVALAAYNQDDCESTWRLRDWLEEQRAQFERVHNVTLPRPVAAEGAVREEQKAVIEETGAAYAALTAGVPEERDARTDEQQAAWLLAQLLGYHRRARNAQWWGFFDRLQMTAAELHTDPESLGPLELQSQEPDGDASIESYTFEPQEHHMGVDDDPLNPEVRTPANWPAPAGKVVAVDSTRGTITLRRNRSQLAYPPPRFLMPGRPFATDAQEAALLAIARWVGAHGIDAAGEHRAARDLLLRRPPRRVREAAATPLRHADESAEQAAVRAVHELDRGCLAVQGPPGSGKTYTAARVALDVVRRRRRRVAVTAVSHRAITKLLEEIRDAAALTPDEVRLLQLIRGRSQRVADGIHVAKNNDEVLAAVRDEAVDVVGGTSWLLSRPEFAEAFDTIIVDEAGQMSLADVIAVSRCARNLVLVGDPRQLSHVVQGNHPEGAEASGLEHLLGDELTVSAGRGIFLDRTWRMRPDVCDFVSRSFYESRLMPEPACARQTIDGEDGLALTGLRLLTVEHSGDRTSSEAEATAVRTVVDALLGRAWTDIHGLQRHLDLDDIVIVAPYNAHVACLVAALPEKANVGTVDKFQGQEAAVSVFSMATSSAEDLPRNLEFLYSLNRLNVAVSRARCLSVIVCSPALLHAPCHTPEQMRLVNALCRYADMAPAWSFDAMHASHRQGVLALNAR
ncbi:MAG: TM0106 family RecB-like putative nuclease [Chloroflexi bacterium]|nr:MAG: TM0106 family RecB-like putative nuclease [Chloroflexota bacterium]